jgi:hypothetical protein
MEHKVRYRIVRRTTIPYNSAMHTFLRKELLFFLTATLAFLARASCSCAESLASAPRCPTKIFLLDGQSNMVGQGSIEHLTKLLQDPDTRDEYIHLWNETSQDWAQRDDVYAKFDSHMGKLTVGYGSPSGEGHLGPELEFGWVLGDALCSCGGNTPIMVLKTAYGGRDLAIDFRPPSSGKGNFPGVKPSKYGWEYRQMISDIQDSLDNVVPTLIPGYDEDVGYVLAGYVWFQGWNDLIDEAKVEEYGSNLANLIRDVREDLDAPEMPFIVGELGMHGIDPQGRARDRVLAMRKAEKEVTLMDEFRNNSLFVPTSPYVVSNGTHYNGDYHYFGRADTYCKIGHAFGEAMLKLMEKGAASLQEDTFWGLSSVSS